MLSLQTYDRVFQRLASTHRAVPLGIYRTVPMSVGEEEEEEDKDSKEESYHDGENIKRFLNARMMSLGLEQVNSTSKCVRWIYVHAKGAAVKEFLLFGSLCVECNTINVLLSI